MGRHLILVGGGHAHLTTLKDLQTFIADGHRVTVVSPSAYQYYSGMGPGMFGGTYRPQDIRFNIRKMVTDRGGAFVEDYVASIAAGERTLQLASGKQLHYDVASFNTGSGVPTDRIEISGGRVYTVKPIINLLKAREEIISGRGTLDVAVVGGGPAGVELAGNLLSLLGETGRPGKVTLVAGQRLLRNFPERVRLLAWESLSRRGCTVLEGTHAKNVDSTGLLLSDNTTHKADLTFLAMGVSPGPLFRESGLPTGPDGGFLVNHYLQCTEHPELFGGGDCISLEGTPLAKVGVYAVRQNPVLFHNLRAMLNGNLLTRFEAGKRYLLIINLGGGLGILHKGPVTFNGKLAFIIKDYIDHRFMRTFQVSGETEEPY